MNLFVYGTLLRGEKNHRLLRQARRLRQAATTKSYRLLDLHTWPALAAPGCQAVYGELYVVSPALLEKLDAFEECPAVYLRLPVALSCQTVAEAYFLQPHLVATQPVLHPPHWPLHAAARGA